MNRRGFFVLLAGVAAIPAAIRAIAAPKCAPVAQLPPSTDEAFRAWAMELTNPTGDAMRGELFASTDVAAFADRDYAVTMVFSRDPATFTLTVHDSFEWPHIAVMEHGVPHLERISIDSVRRAMKDARVYIPSRTHTDDEFADYCDRYGHSDGWKHLELPRR